MKYQRVITTMTHDWLINIYRTNKHVSCLADMCTESTTKSVILIQALRSKEWSDRTLEIIYSFGPPQDGKQNT